MKFLLQLLKIKPADSQSIQMQWDRLRAEALTPSHRSEIDAIFSRQV